MNSYDETLLKVAREFFNVSKILEIKEIEGGHINSTFLVIMPEVQYILQKINVSVFTSPFGMMHNIKEVTEHIKKKAIYEGLNPNKAVLNIVYTIHNQMICIRDDEYWRCFQYIENTVSYAKLDNTYLLYEMGLIVGGFQKLLDGFHTRVLDETIRRFHDTPYRYEKFLNVIKLDKFNRKDKVLNEIEFLTSRSSIFSYIVDRIANKTFPRRVTHNDTKPSNVLFDKNTNKALCLIDLDTVMKGSLLYDYGDALRIGCSTANEDEASLDKVTINLEFFESFTRGFLTEIKQTITKEEVKGLYNGFYIITCEIAMRFLTDYLDGDKYFRIAYPEHNLVRTKNQLKIVSELEKNEATMHKIINKILKELEFSKDYIY